MKHIFILRLIRKEDGSLISERDMDTICGSELARWSETFTFCVAGKSLQME